MSLGRFFLFFCICASCGCSSTKSENVTTEGIAADIDVVANGFGTTVVTAQLEVGSGGIGRTVLELSPGDTLNVTANGMQLPMIEDSSILGDFRYVATFNFDDAGTVFTVAFNRANGITAPNSNVELPDGFVVPSPTINDVFGLNDDISIVWSPSGTTQVPSGSVTISCTQTNGLAISGINFLNLGSDLGATTVSVASAMPAGLLDTGQLCEGTVELSRSRRGNLDPNYGEGGSINAEHFGRADFFVDPAP